MPLFNYKLANIEDVQPWGSEGDYSLHWYGLSLGYYYLDAKNHHLLVYSDEANAHLGIPIDHDKPYIESRGVDYQLARLHEDLLDILHSILEPLPNCITDLVSPIELYKISAKLLRLASDDSQSLTYDDLPINAFEWLCSRHLDTGYLSASPRIYLYRTDESVIVQWDNSDCSLSGIQPWKELKGFVSYSVDEFVSETKRFNDGLMRDMRVRVNEVIDGKLPENIKIDTDYLLKEMNDRETWYDNSIQKKRYHFEWLEVAEDIQKLIALYKKLFSK